MRAIDLLGTRVLLADARQKLRPPALNQLLSRYPRVGVCEVGDATARIPVALHRNPNALPRAFVVHTVHREAGAERAIARVMDPAFDPRREAVVEGELPIVTMPSAGGPARAVITGYEPNRVTIRVDASAPGLLVLTDSYDPDWTVLRDGEPELVLATNGLFRGVAVPAGRSEIEFRYRPVPFVAGASLGALGLAAAGILWRFRRSSGTKAQTTANGPN
jgi:hypothetical protein